MSYNIKPPSSNAFSSFTVDNKPLNRYYLDIDSEKKSQKNGQENKKKSHIIRNTVIFGFGATSLLVAASFIFLTTSATKSFAMNLRRYFNGVIGKFSDKHSIVVEKAIKGSYEKFDKSLNIMANVTPLKDYLFRKLMMEKLPKQVGAKPWLAVTHLYEDLNIKTTKKFVDNTADNMNRVIDWLQYNKLKASGDNRKKISAYISRIEQVKRSYIGGFEARKALMDKDVRFKMNSDINLKVILQNMKKGLVPEMLMKKNKDEFTLDVVKNLEAFTYDLDQVCKVTKDNIAELRNRLLKIDNESVKIETRKFLINLRKDIDEFAKLQDGDERRNPEFLRIKGTISKFSDFLNESLPNMSPDDPFSKGYRDIICSWNTKGSKEGVIEKCRKLVEKDPAFKDQKDEFKKICENAKKSIYRSTASEDKMYDKHREIMLGNGPTDLLSLIAPFVLIGARLSDNDKTKQDKVGIVLQEGVPVIGGVGAYLFGIAKQLTGPTALLTSFGFGVALNTVGSLLFKAYKDAQNINLSLPQKLTPEKK